MITRFDHAIIGVRDLEAAITRWRELGFEVAEGGRHPGRGTRNAIVRFGLDYLELISVYSREEALAAGGNGRVAATFLDGHEGGLLGYALATDDMEALARRCAEAGLEATGPISRERLRPDGRLLRWRLLIPFGASWLTPWPMFIQWDARDAERLAWERPGVHPNGVRGVASVRLEVADLEPARDFYQRQLGLPPASQEVPPRYQVGAFGIEVGSRPGARGGMVELILAAADLERAGEVAGGELSQGRLVLPEDKLLGARIAVVSA
jgi:catechol 2,3-dioxygenase-like lactoylglutathione lyase family enzyme